jgi:hypothetical protein
VAQIINFEPFDFSAPPFSWSDEFFSLTVFNGLENGDEQIFSLIGHVNQFLALSAPPFWVSTTN